jgi:hypothetical protein
METQYIDTSAPGYGVTYCTERGRLSSDGKTLTKEVLAKAKELCVYDKQ